MGAAPRNIFGKAGKKGREFVSRIHMDMKSGTQLAGGEKGGIVLVTHGQQGQMHAVRCST